MCNLNITLTTKEISLLQIIVSSHFQHVAEYFNEDDVEYNDAYHMMNKIDSYVK